METACFALVQGSAYYLPTNEKVPTVAELDACRLLPVRLFHFSLPSDMDGPGSKEQ